VWQISNKYNKRKKDTYITLHDEFFSNMDERPLSVSYLKYLRGNTTISPHVYLWIKHHPCEPIYAGEIIHHINGNHHDNRIGNLKKIRHSDHGKLFVTSLAIQNGICKSSTSRLKSNNLNKPKLDNIKYKHIEGASSSYNNYINNKMPWVASHIKIWIENHPNEIIYEGEVIHHINGNHHDNRIENLEKMTKKEHDKYHNKSL